MLSLIWRAPGKCWACEVKWQTPVHVGETPASRLLGAITGSRLNRRWGESRTKRKRLKVTSGWNKAGWENDKWEQKKPTPGITWSFFSDWAWRMQISFLLIRSTKVQVTWLSISCPSGHWKANGRKGAEKERNENYNPGQRQQLEKNKATSALLSRAGEINNMHN